MIMSNNDYTLGGDALIIPPKAALPSVLQGKLPDANLIADYGTLGAFLAALEAPADDKELIIIALGEKLSLTALTCLADALKVAGWAGRLVRGCEGEVASPSLLALPFDPVFVEDVQAAVASIESAAARTANARNAGSNPAASLPLDDGSVRAEDGPDPEIEDAEEDEEYV